jgi:hypothetical protein
MIDRPMVGPVSNGMAISVEELWSMSERALIGAYHDARRQFVDKKFARDTQRAQLKWMRAKMFVGISGRVTERRMAIDVSEELARKGQERRETHDLDLLKVDVDTIAIHHQAAGSVCASGRASRRHGGERSGGRGRLKAALRRGGPLNCTPF